MRGSKASVLLPLLSLILNGLFLAHDLPEAAHPDETAVVRRAIAMGSGDWNPHFFKYPSLWIYLVFLVQGVGAAMGLAAGVFRGMEDLAVLAVTNPTYYFLVGRMLAGVLGAGAVWVTWYVGGRISPVCGWFSAAALVAFAPFVWQAHYATGDVPLVFFIMLCLAACVRGLATSATRWGWLWQPAVCAGLATSIKYNGAVVFGAVAVMLLLRWRQEGGCWRTYGARLLASTSIAAVSAVVTSPYVFLDVRGLVGGMQEVATGTVFVSWFERDRSAYVRLVVSNWGVVLTAAALVGWGMVFATGWGRRHRPVGWILGGFSLPYIALIQYADYKASRFFLPVAPVVALGAGIAVARWSERLERGTRGALWRGAATLTIVSIALGPAVRETIAIERSFLQETADITSSRWFRGHVQPGTSVFVDAGTNVNLPPDQETVEARIRLWQADSDVRARQLLRAYQYYLKSDLPGRGYRLVPTRSYLLNTFQSGQDPDRDYDVRRVDGVRYVMVDADRLSAPGETPRDSFYRQVRRTHCVRRVFEDGSGARIVVLEREEGVRDREAQASTARECAAAPTKQT